MSNTDIYTRNMSDDARDFRINVGIIAPVNTEYIFDCYSDKQHVIQTVYVMTQAGACNVTVQIDNGSGFVNVSGATSLPVTTTRSSGTATANRTVNVGGTMRLSVDNVVDAENLIVTILSRDAKA